jgi:hypothetical protein
MERSGIAVRWSALLGVSTPAAIGFTLDVASRLNAGTNREPVSKELETIPSGACAHGTLHEHFVRQYMRLPQN